MEKNSIRTNGRLDRALVNNAFYDDLGNRWIEAYDDPVALLRAEGEVKNPWVMKKIREVLYSASEKKFSAASQACNILDIGCGGGFLTHALAKEGYRVMGVDMSFNSLKITKKLALDKMPNPMNPLPRPAARAQERPSYSVADAYHLPFRSQSFEVIIALDFLEHVSNPERVIEEVGRLLKPGGIFFFHTFNRNPIAWLFAIKGLEWFIKNTPKNMHVLPLFIKPKEMKKYCFDQNMPVKEMLGIRPKMENLAFWKLLVIRKVPEDFKFALTSSLLISYLGYAKKSESQPPHHL